MDNVGLDTARPQPARQPEPVASGLVGDDKALDLATRLARFSAPTIQKLQQCFLVGLDISITAITVLSCSRVVRDLLASKDCDMGCSVGLNSAEGVTPSPLAP